MSDDTSKTALDAVADIYKTRYAVKDIDEEAGTITVTGSTADLTNAAYISTGPTYTLHGASYHYSRPFTYYTITNGATSVFDTDDMEMVFDGTRWVPAKKEPEVNEYGEVAP